MFGFIAEKIDFAPRDKTDWSSYVRDVAAALDQLAQRATDDPVLKSAFTALGDLGTADSLGAFEVINIGGNEVVYRASAGQLDGLAIGAEQFLQRAATGNIKAFDKITARVTADQPITTTTLTNVTNMVVALQSTGSYRITGALKVIAAGTTPDMRLAVTFPAAAVCDLSVLQFNRGRWLETSGSASATFQIPSTYSEVLQFSGTIVMGGTSGNLQLQARQSTSSGDAVTMEIGSHIHAEQFA